MKELLSMPNVYLIRGNHEEEYIRYYYSLMAESNEFDLILEKLQRYIQGDGKMLDWETVDAIEKLPYYIETDKFICVHAGISLTGDSRIYPLSETQNEELIYNRRFKNPDVLPTNSKCIFFGHTPTKSIDGKGGILTYIREGGSCENFDDYVKVHLDTGVSITGILGCFCVDNCQCYYVDKKEL